MKRLYTADSEGVFHSPLGEYDPKEEKWETVADLFRDILTQHYPTSSFIEVKTGRKISYRDLFKVGEKLSRDLLELDIAPRTVIHVIGENGLDWVAIMIASHLNHYVISATHPNSPWPECERNIETTCATVAIFTKQCYQKFSDKIGHPFLEQTVVVDSCEDGENYSLSISSSKYKPSRVPDYDRRELDGICQLLLSSGTSGTPKAVKINDKMLISCCVYGSAPGIIPFGPSDVSLLSQPLAHAGGQNFAFIAPVFKGATVVITDYPGCVGLLDIIQKFKLTHILAVPSVLTKLAKYERVEKYDLSSVKYILTFATTPDVEAIKTLVMRSKNHCIKTKNVYGATETTGITFCSNDNIDTNIESIGVSSPGILFKIVRLSSRKPITEPNVEGELLIKQFYPHLLYFNDPEKTKSSLTGDGFYMTGDLAKFDVNFNVFICGRIKDVIKYRGFTVSPAEIENVLRKSDLIQDCAVVAQPDKSDFEIPAAFVVLSELGKNQPSDVVREELIAFVANLVAEHKQLRRVYFINNIPRNNNGKILKRELVHLLSRK